MKKKSKNNLYRILLVSVATVSVAAIVFSALGGSETVRRVYRGYRVRSIYHHEFKHLKASLMELGFANAKSPHSTCERTEFYGMEGKPLWCVATTQKYTVIGSEDAAKQKFVDVARELDVRLQKKGWSTSSNSAKNYEEWMKAITSGVDYNTDINAYINTPDGRCGIGMTVAYANPAPPAINTVLVCNSPGLGPEGEGGIFFHSDGDA